MFIWIGDQVARKVYSVSQVNNYIKNMFEQDYLLGQLSVSGEISNLKYHTSGHIYFTLKETNALISCVMFATYRRSLTFRLQEGQKVVVTGGITVYERDGRYQLYAKQIEDEGEGRLYQEFERLKKELLEMGMFDASFKQPIPEFAKTIGIVTAPTGAAIQDIINISKRRNPFVQLILYPALVQGDGAADSIVKGISILEKRNVDVIIIGRGGGSLEDLWAFNEEQVARAVFECGVPIISAVGHETDFTISDYVADLRAPTPSAAAELATKDIMAVISMLEDRNNQLNRCIRNKIQNIRWKLEQYEGHLNAQSPTNKLREKRMYLIQLEERLNSGISNNLRYKKNVLARYSQAVESLSPLLKLSSGYGFVTDENNKKVTEVSHVEIGTQVTVRLTDGSFKATVNEKSKV